MSIENLKQLIIPILENHDVSRAGIFGSYAKNEQTKDSDIDILIQLNDKISLLEFVRIKIELEDKLNKKVDLVEYQSIKPRLKNRILSEEIRIYG
jgi:predicted nucleotidyltransferase